MAVYMASRKDYDDSVRMLRDGPGGHAIEYKASQKLSQDELLTRLVSDIQPKRDVINRDGDDFPFAAKALATAVVTQLFSYMTGKGIQHGYVRKGQAFVFLRIQDDPTMVSITFFAFTVQALHTAPPPQSWHDAATALDTWAVEYDDINKTFTIDLITKAILKGKQHYGDQHQLPLLGSAVKSNNTLESGNDKNLAAAQPLLSQWHSAAARLSYTTSGHLELGLVCDIDPQHQRTLDIAMSITAPLCLLALLKGCSIRLVKHRILVSSR
ncbi:hypothetical protein VTI28DRAFT_3857 [Corynascus sepedonium]